MKCLRMWSDVTALTPIIRGTVQIDKEWKYGILIDTIKNKLSFMWERGKYDIRRTGTESKRHR